MPTPKTMQCVSNEIETPGGSTLWIPEVNQDVKPFVGQVFNELEDAYMYYLRYAFAGRFGVRSSTQKRLKNKLVCEKHYICSKAGYPEKNEEDTLKAAEIKTTKQKTKMRVSNIKVTGCTARLTVKLIRDGKFKVIKFMETHNHMMCLEEHKYMLKKARKLTFQQQQFIFKMGTMNIGPTKAHNIYKTLKGSYEDTSGTVVDFKNFRRDINAYIGGSDAQILVTKMLNKKNYVADFSFEYKLEEGKLASLFWADEVAKANFKEFGDIVSFDATYSTNKYNMMFVPFTGIDNHRKSVTLGAGLLNNETSDSYIWLLNAFLKTFGVQPRIIVTDQDKAMKIAVDQVLPQSKHRLCMWHITQKLPGKILHDVPDNNEFKKKFNKIVWNMWITPSQFEEDWANLMREYNTQTHKWLTKIYDIRSTWIPAYFADIELCGLMRTTSRSESENSFFGTFNNKRSTLVNFMLCFENAMEKQRYNQDVLDHQTTETVPKYKTQLKIEKHAAKMYTRTIFNLVQIEILKSLWECSIDGLKTEDGFQEYIIKERRKYTEEEAASNEDWESEFWPEDKKTQTYDYKVLYIIEDGSVDCSCKKFTRRGLLCRHIFCVFKNRNIEHIPDKYILRRWTKNPIPVECRKRKRNSTEYDQLLNEASSTFDDCLQLLGSNQERMADFVTKLKQIKMELEDSTSETQPQSKNEIIEQLNGFKKPDICEINNPDVLRYKGCGRDKRLMSTKEKAIKESTKRINKCGKCGLRARGHNSRTCDKKNAEAKAKAAANAKDKAESEASNVAD